MRDPTAEILRYMRKANAVALEYIEHEARRLMSKHPSILGEFVMAMGRAFFIAPDGSILHDGAAETAALSDFICAWDDQFKLTGNPMRFTALGNKITNW